VIAASYDIEENGGCGIIDVLKLVFDKKMKNIKGNDGF
jgi:hypothetical protein